MAKVNHLEQAELGSNAKHSEVRCTYTVVTDADGERCLQLDTYGSPSRELVGKKSQSIRLGPDAIAQLKRIFLEHGL